MPPNIIKYATHVLCLCSAFVCHSRYIEVLRYWGMIVYSSDVRITATKRLRKAEHNGSIAYAHMSHVMQNTSTITPHTFSTLSSAHSSLTMTTTALSPPGDSFMHVLSKLKARSRSASVSYDDDEPHLHPSQDCTSAPSNQRVRLLAFHYLSQVAHPTPILMYCLHQSTNPSRLTDLSPCTASSPKP